MNLALLKFVVPGKPQGKGRPRFTRSGHAYTPEKTRAYERQIADVARAAIGPQQPLDCALRLELLIVFAPPASWSKKRRALALSGFARPMVKPDADNVVKAFGDALEGIVYVNDTQLVEIAARKVYGETDHVSVTVLSA